MYCIHVYIKFLNHSLYKEHDSVENFHTLDHSERVGGSSIISQQTQPSRFLQSYWSRSRLRHNIDDLSICNLSFESGHRKTTIHVHKYLQQKHQLQNRDEWLYPFCVFTHIYIMHIYIYMCIFSYVLLH